MIDRVDIPESLQMAMSVHARELCRRFPMVELQDVKQEMALWWYSHPRKVRRYMDLEDTEQGLRKLSRSLRNAALAYCHKEKAKRVGYEVDDLFFYSVGLLRELLPAVYDEDAWQRVGRSKVDDMPRGKSVPSEGNNVIAGLIDVKRAVERLPTSVRFLLETWVGMAGDEERLGLLLETTSDAARMRVNRALKRLQSELGGERPDWAAAAHGEHSEGLRRGGDESVLLHGAGTNGSGPQLRAAGSGEEEGGVRLAD